VRKSFGDNVVLDGVELAVEEGSVFALCTPGVRYSEARIALRAGERRAG
jgi:hypothetical protein